MNMPEKETNPIAGFWEALTSSFTWRGRASRFEYWSFFLISQILLYALAFVAIVIPVVWIIFVLFQMAVTLATIAVMVRRIHDTDNSGWWALFPFVNLGFMFLGPTKGENSYGSDPKACGAES